MNRRNEIEQNLNELNQRIEKACTDSGRSFDEVKTIAITKTWPTSDIEILYDLGLRNFGESKDQEAIKKVEELRGKDIHWHFVGQIQTNKINHIASYADYVHAIDRNKVVEAFENALEKNGRSINALIQVSLDGDESRGGALPEAISSIAKAIEDSIHLTLGGLMAVAPVNQSPEVAFKKLSEIAGDFHQDFPSAQMISAGMSDDLEIAIKYGATHLRIGSDLLGNRE